MYNTHQVCVTLLLHMHNFVNHSNSAIHTTTDSVPLQQKLCFLFLLTACSSSSSHQFFIPKERKIFYCHVCCVGAHIYHRVGPWQRQKKSGKFLTFLREINIVVYYTFLFQRIHDSNLGKIKCTVWLIYWFTQTCLQTYLLCVSGSTMSLMHSINALLGIVTQKTDFNTSAVSSLNLHCQWDPLQTSFRITTSHKAGRKQDPNWGGKKLNFYFGVKDEVRKTKTSLTPRHEVTKTETFRWPQIRGKNIQKVCQGKRFIWRKQTFAVQS